LAQDLESLRQIGK